MAEVAALVAAHTMQGSLTAYGGEFIGQRLFCATQSNPLYYDHNTPPWIALPASQHGITWQCGDLIYIPGLGTFRALDAGPFGDHCVVTGDQCLPIVADIPTIHAPFKLSMAGEWVNLSAVVRECRERGMCD